jgi:ubiquinone/menaquinone biosynthesis C-methylase UbiE
LLAAYLKSRLGETHDWELLPEEDLSAIARKNKIKIHFLKRLNNPRIIKSVGMILNVWPDSLLDIGVGKGYMLWQLIEKMPDLKISCIDISTARIDRIESVFKAANILNASALTMDAEYLEFPDNSFCMVSLFELLEHVSNPEKALKEALRVADKCLAFSFPCKPDNNKEHIHFFDKDRLFKLLESCGIKEKSKIEKDSSTWYVLVNKR